MQVFAKGEDKQLGSELTVIVLWEYRIGTGKRSFISSEQPGPGPAAYDTMKALKRGVIKNCPTAKYYQDLNLSLQSKINEFNSTALQSEQPENEDISTKQNMK